MLLPLLLLPLLLADAAVAVAAVVGGERGCHFFGDGRCCSEISFLARFCRIIPHALPMQHADAAWPHNQSKLVRIFAVFLYKEDCQAQLSGENSFILGCPPSYFSSFRHNRDRRGRGREKRGREKREREREPDRERERDLCVDKKVCVCVFYRDQTKNEREIERGIFSSLPPLPSLSLSLWKQTKVTNSESPPPQNSNSFQEIHQ